MRDEIHWSAAIAAGVVGSAIAFTLCLSLLGSLSDVGSTGIGVYPAVLWGAPAFTLGALIAALTPSCRWRVAIPVLLIAGIAAAFFMVLVAALTEYLGGIEPLFMVTFFSVVTSGTVGVAVTPRKTVIALRVIPAVLPTLAILIVLPTLKREHLEREQVWRQSFAVQDQDWQRRYRESVLPAIDRSIAPALEDPKAVAWPNIAGPTYRSFTMVGLVPASDFFVRMNTTDLKNTVVTVPQERALAGNAKPADFRAVGFSQRLAQSLKRDAEHTKHYQAVLDGIRYDVYVDLARKIFNEHHLNLEPGYNKVAPALERHPLWMSLHVDDARVAQAAGAVR